MKLGRVECGVWVWFVAQHMALDLLVRVTGQSAGQRS